LSEPPVSPAPVPEPDSPAPSSRHPHRRRRWFYGCGLTVLGLLLLLAFAVWFLLGTQAGTRFLFTRLGALMPGTFDVAEIHGPIRGPLDIRGLTYKKAGAMEVHVAHLHLEWRLRELLARRLDVEKLYADGIRIVQAPPTQEKTPLPDVNLRFNILVRDAKVRGLDVDSQDGKSVVKIDSIDLITRELSNVFHLDHLTVRSPVVNADVTGRLQPQGDYPLDLTAHWSVRPPGMAEVAGNGTLSGTLKRLQVTQTVTAPFPVQVNTLLLEPLYDLRFDGRVAFQNVNPKVLKADLPDLPASGEVTLRGSLPAFTSDGTVRGRFAPAGDFAMRYRLAREGKDGETWRIDQADVTLPGTPTRLSASGRYTSPPTPPTPAPGKTPPSSPLDTQIDVTWHALAWPPRVAKPSFESPDGRARIEAHGTVEALNSSGTVEATLAPFGRLAAVYRVVRQGDNWKIERADLSLPGTPTRASVTGLVRTPKNGPLGFDANASWQDVAWPLHGTPTVRSAAGRAAVSGTTDRYNARVDADVAGAPGGQIPSGHWVVAGEGTPNEFRMASLAGDVLEGHLTGRGMVGWSPRVRWDLDLQGQGLNPAAVKADFPGKLDLALKTRGEMRPEGPVGTVDLPRLAGTLRQQPISANAAVRLTGTNYDISHLDAHWGDAHVDAKGRVGDRFDLAWDLTLPNLGLVVPQANGAIGAQGHLAGPLRTPHVTANAHFDGLRSGTQSVGQGTLQADVDLAPAGITQLDLTARQIQAGGQSIGGATVQLRGTLNRHTLAASLTDLGIYPKARLDLTLAGAATGEVGPQLAWQGQIQRLDLRGSPAGDWSLEQAATLAASAGTARLDGFCWRSPGTTGTAGTSTAKGAPPAPATGPARLCAGGSWAKAGAWSGQATLASLPLSLLKPLLPPDLTIAGNVEGTARASGSPRGMGEVVADLSPGPGDLRFPGEDGRTTVVHFERGTIHARLEPTGGDANAKLTLTHIGDLGLTARLPGLQQRVAVKDLPLSGRVDANFRDLSFLEGFVPDLRGVTGSLVAGFQLGGTVGTPRLNGQAKLANGRARVPEYGLDVRDVTLTATGNGSPLLTVTAGARSGPGTVAIEGSTGLFPTAATPLHMKITGRRFQVTGTREMTIQVSPDLDLNYGGTQASLTGQVNVPYARTNIEDRKKPGAVPVSKDVVFVRGGPAQVKKTPLSITARVRLVLGDDIELKALGLDAKPKGSILVVEQPGRPESAVGEIEVSEGTFKAYGQDLTIERGRLIFAGGPLDDPGIDLRAYRTATDGTIAGIEAQGTLKKPEVTLYSTPTMTESEALAYLLLGHPLGQASPQEGSLLANAATSLGLKGGNLIAKRLATRFGLESATLESSGGLDQTALVLGKYLSPRLYVSYGIGLFEPINTFRIRYIMNKQFTLQAESGTGTSADVLYTREH